MKRRVVLGLFSLAAAAAMPGRTLAQMQMPMGSDAKMPPKPSAAEQPFITKLMDEMPKRYGTTAAAAKAGYFQYTGEDSTGAISWVKPNLDTAKDFNDPSQLWYDVNGKLLGVDYTLETAQFAKPPATLFGYTVDAGRYLHRGAHMHWGVKNPDGTMKFGGMARSAVRREPAETPNSTQLDLPQNKAALVKAGIAQEVRIRWCSSSSTLRCGTWWCG